MNEQVNLCRKLFPQSVVVKRPRNYGCGRSIIDARSQLFTNFGYEYVFMFEDDTVVSPYYIGMMQRLMKWSEDRFDNVGTVQGWSMSHASREDKLGELGSVYTTYNN